MRSTVIPIVVLAALLGPAAAMSPAASTLLFDATLTRQGGVLRDGHRQPIGHFSLACTKTRCAGLARTADGRLRFTGPAGAHAWAVRGVSGAYRGAHGRFQVRDITDREWLITMTVTPRSALHVALVRRFASNARFVARAHRACAGASRQLAALPAFPFSDFDPLHPNAALLPQVGAYFTGPGDPAPSAAATGRRAPSAWRTSGQPELVDARARIRPRQAGRAGAPGRRSAGGPRRGLRTERA